MSYPKNLGQRIQYITNNSTNSVKLNPDNSATLLTDITSGAKLQFTLPPNSLVYLSSFSVCVFTPSPPDPPIMGDSSIGELHFDRESRHKNPIKSRAWPAPLRHSPGTVHRFNKKKQQTPRRMLTLLLLGIRGLRKRTLTM